MTPDFVQRLWITGASIVGRVRNGLARLRMRIEHQRQQRESGI
jgi:hypothetical protein